MIAAGVRFGCVLADVGYEPSAPFRQGLTARKLAWAVGIPRHLKVYPVGVRLIWPITKVRGRPRKRHVPDTLSIAAEDMLANAKWKNVSWRSGTKGRLEARFAAVRVRTADGPPQRIWDKGQQHLPVTRLGSSASNACRERKSTILPTCQPRWICATWRPQSKRDRSASRPSATERGAWPRPLRRQVLAWTSSSCAHDNDRIRLPAASPPHKSEAGKESSDRRLNQACQPSVTPSSRLSLDHHRSDAHTVENGFARARRE